MHSSIGPPTEGRLVAGRYRLLEIIGTGGMGEVWRAHDEHLDRDVAVKLLNGAASDGAAEDEARIAARLVHPNIVRVYDVGGDDGLTFVVMELVAGAPLNTLRDVGQLRSAAHVADIGAQLADALDHAHRAGVIHCDVKPQNVVMTGEGVPKLLDFGISRRAAADAESSSQEFLGSLPYVAPEQVRGKRPDARTDVYALGAVLYELLTGQAPFFADSAEESLRRRLDSPPRPPRSLDPAIPAALEAVVLRAMAIDSADRFQSAGALAEALRAALPSAGASEAVTQRYPTPVTRQASPAGRGHGAALLGAATVALAAVALMGVCSMRTFRDDSTAIAPALAEPQPTPTSALEPTSTPTATVSAPIVDVGPPARPQPAPAEPQMKPEAREHTPPGQAKKAGGKHRD